ncbi:MAG: RidA family protein [Terriglobia bacterium]
MKELLKTKKAPAAIGPYSQGVKANGFLFLSGQIPLDPESGQFIAGDIRAQTERVLKNLQAVLEAAGSSLAAVVKSTVYLADLDDFAAMNEVYARFFSQEPPARATVQAARLPKGARIEIDLVAVEGK